MFLQVGNFNAARCVPTKRGMDDYKNRLYCSEYSLFSYGKIDFFLLVFFLTFAQSFLHFLQEVLSEENPSSSGCYKEEYGTY